MGRAVNRIVATGGGRAVERWLALRYLATRQSEGFVSFIAIFSLIGIALGVATLIVVLSVMGGFRASLIGRLIGMNGHIVITAKSGLLQTTPELLGDSQAQVAQDCFLENGDVQPMRAAAEKAGSADFTSLWSGQAPTFAREMPAGDLVGRLVAESAEVARRFA